MTDTIAQLIRGKIAELENEIAAAERALRAAESPDVHKIRKLANAVGIKDKDIVAIGAEGVTMKPNSNTTLADIIIEMFSRGPENRKAIVSAVQAIRPETNPQTVSGTLNAAQKAGKIKLNKKTKQWQMAK